MLALASMRVLEVTQAMAGPFCGLLLAEMGAEVIKVESRERGEAARRSGPHYYGNESATFMAVNRNKKSVVLDLKAPAGREAFIRLARRAHVILENNRPGVMDRLGLGWEVLRAENPGLIYASISGFGQTGPYAHRGGYDLIAQGMSGIMSVTGEPGRPPVKAGVPVTDLGAALFCCYGILSAYIYYLQTGQGQRVDTSLFEAGIGLSVWESTELWASGNIPQPQGSAHRNNAPYQALRAADGYFTVGSNDRLWPRFCEVLGDPELARDERFQTRALRKKNEAALIPRIEAITQTRPVAYWLERLEAVGVPAGPIYTYDQVFRDPQTIARQMVVEYDHPTAGRVKTLGKPVKLSLTPGKAPECARLGEHTLEILTQVGGLTREEVDGLIQAGVAYQASLGAN